MQATLVIGYKPTITELVSRSYTQQSTNKLYGNLNSFSNLQIKYILVRNIKPLRSDFYIDVFRTIYRFVAGIVFLL